MAEVARCADRVYCANVRAGGDFAVADAYVIWRDIFEPEAEQILVDFGLGRPVS